MSDEKHLSLRIQSDLLKKFRFVCDFKGRSANRQLLRMISEAVKEYEKDHGPIDLGAQADD